MDEREKLEHALWMSLMLRCDRCNHVVVLNELESLCDDNTPKWAATVAEFAETTDWRSLDGWELVCQNCTQNS